MIFEFRRTPEGNCVTAIFVFKNTIRNYMEDLFFCKSVSQSTLGNMTAGTEIAEIGSKNIMIMNDLSFDDKYRNLRQRYYS